MVFVGFTIGAAIGRFAIAGLLRIYGWPVVFVVGGIIPLVLVPLIMVLLPEARAGREHGRRVRHPDCGSGARAIVASPDGRLFFGQYDIGRIGEIRP